MAYDLGGLASAIVLLLERTPTRTLDSIAIELKVGRHTITRALNRNGYGGFRGLRREIQKTQILNALGAERWVPTKIISSEAGYSSTSAFSNRVRRLMGCPPSRLRGSNKNTE
jgi:methylphosphotriester-DNA--protein-cysteine methyltransferase